MYLYFRALKLLSRCRESCRKYYVDNSARMTPPQKQFLTEVGGLNDVVVDMFGNIIPICDLRQGFTAYVREEFMELHQVQDLHLYIYICLIVSTFIFVH
jgi:hypothetical protein